MVTTGVVMTTYNGQPYVREQLGSILAQSVPPQIVVVCDDGSTDDTIAIVEEMATRSEVRVELIGGAGPPLGVVENIQRGIRACSTDVVVLADQDDRWQRRKLERIGREFGRGRVSALFTNATLIDGLGRDLRGTLWDRVGFTPRREREWRAGHALEMLLKGDVVTGATLAVARGVLQGLLPLPAQGWHDRSIALMLGLLDQIEPMNEPLMSYRLHGRNQAGVPTPHLLPGPNAAMTSELQSVHDQLRAISRHPAVADADPRALALVQAKAEHLARRLQLPARRSRRLLPIADEWRRGGYRRYGATVKAPLRDLL